MPRFEIQQEFDDEDVFIIDTEMPEDSEAAVTITHNWGTPGQRAELARVIKSEMIQLIELSKPFADKLIRELALSKSVRLACIRAKILTVRELVQHTKHELLRMSHFGVVGVRNIEKLLADNGLRLKEQND